MTVSPSERRASVWSRARSRGRRASAASSAAAAASAPAAPAHTPRLNGSRNTFDTADFDGCRNMKAPLHGNKTCSIFDVVVSLPFI